MLEWSAIGEFVHSAISSDGSSSLTERKAGPVSTYCASRSGLDLVSLKTLSGGNFSSRTKARTHLDVFQQTYCVGEGYFFFFLPVFFFAFLAFLAMLPSAIPKLVQCKSTSRHA
jgi:hypothetical protein